MTPLEKTRLRARLDALLADWEREYDTVLNLACLQGRRLSYLAGPTDRLPLAPPQRLPIDERVLLLAYGGLRGGAPDRERLIAQARQADLAPAALALAAAGTEMTPA